MQCVPQLARRHALHALARFAFEDMHDLADPLDAALGVLRLPFQMRQCRRSTSATITAFAVTRSVDKFAAASLMCCKRIAIWNQSRIGRFITPALAKTARDPEQPSVKAVTSVASIQPTFPGFALSVR
jgi:hypothetical protein